LNRNIKKQILLIFIAVLITVEANTQSLVKINPDSVTQGQYVKIAITGTKTSFKSITNPAIVYFVKNYDLKIWADSLEINNDTFMFGYFQIPYTFSGSYDLIINSTPFLSFTNALFIKTQPIVPEITRIDPDSAYQGTYFAFRIYGKNTHFTNCSYLKVWLLYSYADAVTVINDTTLDVSKQVKFSINPGKYSIKIENSRDGVIIKSMILTVLKSPYAPELIEIKPDSAEQGKTIKTVITARNTFFTTSKVQYVRIWQNNDGIYCDSFKIINDTVINAWFKPVYSSYTGIYDLQVKHTPDEVLLLKSCFKVTATKNPPKIISISPDSAVQNDNVTIHIRGYNTHFTFLNRKPGIHLKLNTYYISSFSDITVVNDTYFYATTKIPLEAPVGIYRVGVYDSMDGKMLLENAFKVKKMPDAPTVNLGLPDTMIYGEKYMMRVFCKNTKYSLGFPPYFRLDIGANPGGHFDQDEIFIINDTIVFSTIKASKYWNAPYGIYDIILGNSKIGFIKQNYAVTLIPGKYEPQIQKIAPDKFLQGGTYSIDIIGKNTKFTKATSQQVYLYYSWSDLKPATSFNVVNDTLIKATFIFPTGYLGRWKISVRDSVDKELTFPIEIVLPSNVPQITEITPNYYKIGEKQNFIIHSKYTQITQDTYGLNVFLVRNMTKDTIYATNFKVIDDTATSFELMTSKTVNPGEYDVYLWPIGLKFIAGLKINRFSINAKILNSVPDSSEIGKKISLLLNCRGTIFSKDEIIYPVFTSPSGKYLYADSIGIINDTVIKVFLNIPQEAETGFWDITLLTDQEGDFHLKDKFKIRSDVSINEITNSNTSVYPNPFSDYIKIQSVTSIKQIVLYDLTGKALFDNNLINNSQWVLSTINLDSGVYVLKVIDEKQVILKKIIKK